VDLPVSLAELREIPRMVKDQLENVRQILTIRDRGRPWREAIELAAGKHLESQFGYLPLIKDISRIMDFVNRVDLRETQLKSMMSSGAQGVSRSATTWNDRVEFAPWRKFITHFYQESNQVDLIWATERKQWVSLRWKLLSDISHHSDAELRALASRLVFGQYASLSTLWDGMPWSWLIDWFGNIGDLLAGQRNYLPVQATNSCIMTKTVTKLAEVRYVGSGSRSYSLTPGPATRTNLKRDLLPSAPHPEFGIPFLDARQLSILSALSVTRNGNRLTG
jgi:hypothetical protein